MWVEEKIVRMFDMLLHSFNLAGMQVQEPVVSNLPSKSQRFLGCRANRVTAVYEVDYKLSV